jgi:hypothetical protein
MVELIKGLVWYGGYAVVVWLFGWWLERRRA